MIYYFLGCSNELTFYQLKKQHVKFEINSKPTQVFQNRQPVTYHFWISDTSTGLEGHVFITHCILLYSKQIASD